MAGEQKQPRASHDGLTVINAGIFKTGTASMAEAYRILGLRPHHGLDLMDLPHHWATFEKAAEAAWPDAPRVRPGQKPLTREEWDEILADYDAVTDAGALFAEQLAEVYPEAKVVVVERDFGRWEESFERQILAVIWSPLGDFMHWVVTPVLGHRGMDAMKKMCYGHWEARNVDEIRRNARRGYEAYYRRIREIIHAERRLEYKLGDGWEPLCEFLGKEVPPPGVKFPRVNEKEAHTARQMEQVYILLVQAVRLVAPWLGAAMTVGAGVLFARRSGIL